MFEGAVQHISVIMSGAFILPFVFLFVDKMNRKMKSRRIKF